MKKFIFAALLALFAVASSSARSYKNGSLQYSQNNKYGYSHSMYGFDDVYFGFRIGPSFTSISTDEDNVDYGNKVGLNFGVATGLGLSNKLPIYLETGLYYNEKGGKTSIGKSSIKYRLNYLEIPVAFKYQYEIEDGFTIQPYLGAYLAYGISGKIKDYAVKESEGSFKNTFNRCDAGMKIGCGAQYDMVYVELNYDLGLANILDDEFNSAHNRAFTINVGLNF